MSVTEPSSLAAYPRPSSPEPPEQSDLKSGTIRLWNAFATLPIECRRWALSVGEVESARAGDRVSAAGEVAMVVSGCLAGEARGSAITTEILGPGDLLAAGGDAGAGQWITDGELFRVSATDWERAAGSEGIVYLLNQSVRRRARLERQILCATSHRATARVADVLLAIHEASGQVGIPLSQERLGDMLGLRRTTVNGSCRELETDGGLRTRRGGVRLLDVQAVAAQGCGCRRAAVARESCAI